jgi:ATP-dependent Zn protease
VLRAADERARSLLAENRGKLDALARGLAEKEELDEAEIAVIIGPAAERRYTKNGEVS